MAKIKQTCRLSDSDLVNLYTTFHNLERDICSEIYKLISIFFNANFLILGGSIVIYTTMGSSIFKNICIVLCGFFLIALSIAFIKMTGRAYMNQLDCIAQCGHIEDLLDFNSSLNYGTKNYFKGEGLMVNRHLIGRLKGKELLKDDTKEAFTKIHVKKGQRKYIKISAYIFILFGLVLIASVVLSYAFQLQL